MSQVFAGDLRPDGRNPSLGLPSNFGTYIVWATGQRHSSLRRGGVSDGQRCCFPTGFPGTGQHDQVRGASFVNPLRRHGRHG